MLKQKTIITFVGALILIGCSVEEPKGGRFTSPDTNSSLTNKTFDDKEFDCNQTEVEREDTTIQLQDQPTYLKDIKPLVDKHCISCHNPNGNSPDLTDYAKLKANADASRAEIGAGSMPLAGALETAKMELFELWIEHEMPEGESTGDSNNNSADAMVNKCI